jgi:hypothetical protein
MTRYINLSERYGGQEDVTLEDYRELNPEGKFEETTRKGRQVIIERYGPSNRDIEVLAEEVTDQDHIR